MSVARGLICSRLSGIVAKKQLFNNQNRNLIKQFVRNSHGDEQHWYYRRLPPMSTGKDYRRWEFVGIVFWWWVVWHFLTDYHELIGESFPDPSKYTDEELGIPQD